MRALLASALLVGLLALLVGATVFRNQRARGTLRFLRNGILLYIAVIFLVAAFRIWQRGGL